MRSLSFLAAAFALWTLLPSAPLEAADEVEFSARITSYRATLREATTAFDAGEHAKAADAYSRALAESPFVAEHYRARGVAYYKLAKHAEAIADFDRALMLEPRLYQAMVYRGLALEASGRFADALESHTRAAAAKPNDATAQNNLAWLYATAPDVLDPGRALEHASKAEALSRGQNAQILDTLARAYFVNGRLDDAIAAQKRAIALDAESREFKSHLAEYESARNAAVAGKER